MCPIRIKKVVKCHISKSNDIDSMCGDTTELHAKSTLCVSKKL